MERGQKDEIDKCGRGREWEERERDWRKIMYVLGVI